MKKSKIAKEILRLRKVARLSQSQLATKAGISFRTYQRIESGEYSPKIETVFCILEALKCDPAQVLVQLFKAPPAEMPVANNHLDFTIKLNENPALVEKDEIDGIKLALTIDCSKQKSQVGYWEWNITKQEFYWCDQMYAVYEQDKKNSFDSEAYNSKFNPEDLININKGIDQLINENRVYTNTHPIKLKDGTTAKISAVAKKYINNGEVIIFGIAERVY